MEPKTPQSTITNMTEIVLPNDTNLMNNLRGGKVLHWMDIAAAITSHKHSDSNVVTAGVDNVSFQNPIRLGDLVTIRAIITRAFKTSMEIFVEVWSQSLTGKEKKKSNEAYYTFVALDKDNNLSPVPEVIPETEAEKEGYNNALKRRELRLILSGRIDADKARSLKEYFDR